ncbi:MAG: sigma-54-dependent Fis family transcriptional regulator [Nitrospirae bacterium]|nr:sigma-54-dependent Fis family transcriptional regulator [Nitrospirota bacterium]
MSRIRFWSEPVINVSTMLEWKLRDDSSSDMVGKEKDGGARKPALANSAGFTILIAEDEASLRLTLSDFLHDSGFEVDTAADGAEAQRKMRARSYNLVILDIRLPKVDGLSLFHLIRQSREETRVILMTAFASVTDAVKAVKQGAYDYLTKPFDRDELLIRVRRIQEESRLRSELEEARRRLSELDASRTILGGSPRMRFLLDQVGVVAASESNVLINGETGTGKELLAREVHRLSSREAKPFVAVNCAAFPETLLEAELFGYERGAFTGAVKRRDGRFKAADGGTLLLDDVSEIPLPAQAKLLRVIQEGTFEPLGTNASVQVNVRIISTTNVDLRRRSKEGRFREDLYFRLNVVCLEVPPLRDRKDDIPILVAAFLGRLASKQGSSRQDISPTAWAALTAYAWPGNVRELEHAIEHASILARGGEIDAAHLPEAVRGTSSNALLPDHMAPGSRGLEEVLKSFEREYLSKALQSTGWRRQETADLLGISRKTLWEKLREHGLNPPAEKEEEDEAPRQDG